MTTADFAGVLINERTLNGAVRGFPETDTLYFPFSNATKMKTATKIPRASIIERMDSAFFTDTYQAKAVPLLSVAEYFFLEAIRIV